MGRATPLGIDLDHAPVLAGRGHHGLAFHDIVTRRLLHPDVAPGLDGGDHGEGMPVIRGRDLDDVQVLLLEHLSIVRIGARGLPGSLTRSDQFGRVGQHILVDIAETDHFRRCHLQQAEQGTLAIPAGSNQADTAGPFRGKESRIPTEGRHCHTGRTGFHEFSTVHAWTP